LTAPTARNSRPKSLIAPKISNDLQSKLAGGKARAESMAKDPRPDVREESEELSGRPSEAAVQPGAARARTHISARDDGKREA